MPQFENAAGREVICCSRKSFGTTRPVHINGVPCLTTVPDQKWYQKESVQSALVTGVFLLLSVTIPLLKDCSSADTPRVLAQSPAQATQHPVESGPKYDVYYSSESVRARRTLRANLRHLSAAESNLEIQHIPPGTFGFSLPWLSGGYDSQFKVDRVPAGRYSFEVHKVAADKIYAIAFVNADNQRKLQLEARVTQPITIYSEMWNDAPYPVPINVASCVGESRAVTLDDGRALFAVDCAPPIRK